jgi:hypothetical protein
MDGGARWWLPLLGMTFCCSPAAVVVCAIVLAQTLMTSAPGSYGRTQAVVSSSIGLGLSLLSLLYSLASAAASG